MPPKKPKMTFIEAAKKNGYMMKGQGFKPLPKKGTQGNRLQVQRRDSNVLEH